MNSLVSQNIKGSSATICSRSRQIKSSNSPCNKKKRRHLPRSRDNIRKNNVVLKEKVMPAKDNDNDSIVAEDNYYSIKHELQLDCLVGVKYIGSPEQQQLSTSTSTATSDDGSTELDDLHRVDGIVPLSKLGYRQDVHLQHSQNQHQQQQNDYSGLMGEIKKKVCNEYNNNNNNKSKTKTTKKRPQKQDEQGNDQKQEQEQRQHYSIKNTLHLDCLIGVVKNNFSSDVHNGDFEETCDDKNIDLLHDPSGCSDGVLQIGNQLGSAHDRDEIVNDLKDLAFHDTYSDVCFTGGKSSCANNNKTSLPLLTIQSKSVSSIVTNKKNHQKFIDKHKEWMVTTIGNNEDWTQLRKELRRSGRTSTMAVQEFLAKKSILRFISEQVEKEAPQDHHHQEDNKAQQSSEVVKVLTGKPIKDLQQDFKRAYVSTAISSILNSAIETSCKKGGIGKPSFLRRRSFKWDEMPSVAELSDDVNSVSSEKINEQSDAKTKSMYRRNSLELGSRIWKSEPSVYDKDSMSSSCNNIYSTTKKMACCSSLPTKQQVNASLLNQQQLYDSSCCKREEEQHFHNSLSSALSDALKIGSLVNFEFEDDSDDDTE